MNGERLTMGGGRAALASAWIYQWTFLCLLFLLVSCGRRELTYSDESEILLIADWGKAGLSEQEGRYGATAIFYPTNGGTSLTVLMGDRSRKSVRLKEGCYDIVLFNRSFDDFSSIAFRGMETHHTLEAYARNIQVKGTDNGKMSMDSPDELAADCVEGFEVTPDMLGNYGVSPTRSMEIQSPCQLCFNPRKLTKEITATFHIKGMNNTRSATCTLGGMPESVFLASGKSSERTMTQQFGLDKKNYLPGSQTEGTMSATFSVFGFDESILHEVHFKAQLVDGETEFVEELNDITVNLSEDSEGTVHITIDVICGETVPTVKPEGSSGMDADVDSWDEEENRDIDI